MPRRDPNWWLEQDFHLARAPTPHEHIMVLREDLLEGGSKTRFLPFLLGDAEELVFGGPFCGGAPYALSVLGREEGRKVTLFYAERAELHPRQRLALANGARLEFVRPGYMTVVQARARAYAAKAGATFLPLGFDLPEAEAPFLAAMLRLKKRAGGFDQVWAAAGSGMLVRCLGQAFAESAVHGVAVGLTSRHDAQVMPPNVTLHDCPYRFEQPCREVPPFPSCPNYDAKAWAICAAQSTGRVLFWNVLA